jgi:hypothetical protein
MRIIKKILSSDTKYFFPCLNNNYIVKEKDKICFLDTIAKKEFINDQSNLESLLKFLPQELQSLPSKFSGYEILLATVSKEAAKKADEMLLHYGSLFSKNTSFSSFIIETIYEKGYKRAIDFFK